MFGGIGGLRYVEAGGFVGVVGWVGDVEDDGCCEGGVCPFCKFMCNLHTLELRTLFIFALFVFVASVVQLDCDSEVCLGNVWRV